jgi:hypothetical protein
VPNEVFLTSQEKENAFMEPSQSDDPPSGEQVLSLFPQHLRLLARHQTLLISLEDRVVTLYGEARRVLALGHFSAPAFRLLVVLLLAPEGASYEVLYAGLSCSDERLRQLLAERTVRVPAFQEEVAACRAYLEPLTHRARQTEFKHVRRAVKGPFGVADVLLRRGFGWHVQTLHRQGYLLVTEPVNDGRP